MKQRFKILTYILGIAVMCVFSACSLTGKDNNGKEDNVANAAVKAEKPAKVEIKSIDTKSEKVTIKWKEVSGADGYEVYRSDGKGKSYKSIKCTSDITYTDSDVKERNEYSYQVTAYKFTHEDGSVLKEGDVSISAEGDIESEKDTSKKVKLYGNNSAKKAVYVRPKKAVRVIAGECFVEGLDGYASGELKGFKFVHTVGVNTYTMIHSNSISYNGTLVTPLERICYYKPDRVYFLVGMNESGNGISDGAVANIKKMCKNIRKINPHAEIVLLPVAPCGRHSSANVPSLSKRLSFNKGYKKFTETKDYLYYYDYTPVLDDGQGYLKKSCDGGDGCHWTVSATVSVAKAIKKYDKKNF